MLMVNFITWWYTKGWKTFFKSCVERLKGALDFFSIGSLLRTLFSPFRQIDAGASAHASFSQRFQAALSRLFSRIIGAVIRLFILLFGLIALLFILIISTVMMLIWPLLPAVPIAGIVLTIMQVTF